MKRMIVYLKRLLSLYIDPPVFVPSSVSGFEPIPHVHYVPALDEPSLFGNGPDGVNRAWLSWYLKKNTSKGYMAALVAAHKIRIGLNNEPARVYSNSYLPPILIGPGKQISFEWVIWYRYEFDWGFEDAHQIAVNITGKE